jgi:activator of HSP90 ATPase
VRWVAEKAGETKEDKDVTGTITVPEVAHDTEEDEYVFDVDIYSETSSKSALRPLIRASLVPQLRRALAQFSTDLIATHGKDVYNPSMNSTPATSIAGTPAISKPPSPAPAQKPGGVHTTTVTEDIEFQTSAKDLYDVFVQPAKLAAWTRSAPQVDPRVGGQVVLFQGNVRGEFTVLEEGKKIEQTWRLPQWPQGTNPPFCLLGF